MALSITETIRLYSHQTGLTLSAQPKTSAGASTGSAITTGFVEVGGGAYVLAASVPDDTAYIVYSASSVVVATGDPIGMLLGSLIKSDLALTKAAAQSAATSAGQLG